MQVVPAPRGVKCAAPCSSMPASQPANNPTAPTRDGQGGQLASSIVGRRRLRALVNRLPGAGHGLLRSRGADEEWAAGQERVAGVSAVPWPAGSTAKDLHRGGCKQTCLSGWAITMMQWCEAAAFAPGNRRGSTCAAWQGDLSLTSNTCSAGTPGPEEAEVEAGEGCTRPPCTHITPHATAVRRG